ncbi:MAG: VOC family protein [Chloroflexia bacterium]
MSIDPSAKGQVPRLFRVILPVGDIDEGARFYGQVLGIPGERVWENRHYFDCGGTILALVSPYEGNGDITPNPEHIFFAVSDIEAVYERAKDAGCRLLDDEIEVQHWGERAFFAEDPFGNPISFVDEATLYTGESPVEPA